MVKILSERRKEKWLVNKVKAHASPRDFFLDLIFLFLFSQHTGAEQSITRSLALRGESLSLISEIMHRLVPRSGYPNSAELLRKSRALTANSRSLAVNGSRYVSNEAAREPTEYDVIEKEAEVGLVFSLSQSTNLVVTCSLFLSKICINSQNFAFLGSQIIPVALDKILSHRRQEQVCVLSLSHCRY